MDDAPKPSLTLLAARESAILELERQRARIPEEIARADARAAAARATAAELRAKVEAADKQRRNGEAQAQDLAAKRDKFHAQSAVVKTNKEYTTLLHEIETHNQQIAKIEDEILVAMEASESHGVELRGADAVAKQVDQEVKKETDELRARLAEVERRLAAGVEERLQLLAALGPQVQALYTRVTKQRSSGIAWLEQSSCSGCHHAVPPEVINRVRAGEVHACASCQRIFVLREGT
jgi:hypothetical protein